MICRTGGITIHRQGENRHELRSDFVSRWWGIRGIIPLKVMEYIEVQTGRGIHELFDVVGGTSTGVLFL